MLAYRTCTSSVLSSYASEDTDETGRAKHYSVTPRRFGQQIRSLRRARGLTQERLAERSDLSTDAIRRIEAGRLSPTLATIGKLATGLQLSLSTLFAGVERPARPLAAEIADYLSDRSTKDCELAWRVVRRPVRRVNSTVRQLSSSDRMARRRERIATRGLSRPAR